MGAPETLPSPSFAAGDTILTGTPSCGDKDLEDRMASMVSERDVDGVGGVVNGEGVCTGGEVAPGDQAGVMVGSVEDGPGAALGGDIKSLEARV